jgi:hypothetical protein
MLFLHSNRMNSRLFIFAISILFLTAILSPTPAQLPPSRPGQGGSRPPFVPKGPGGQIPPTFPDGQGPPTRIPGLPNPNFPGGRPLGGEESISIWSCSNCGKELGRGITPPAIEKCPNCGAHFINGRSPRNEPVQPPTGGPPSFPAERGISRPPFRPPDFQQPSAVTSAETTAESEPSDGFYRFGVAMGIGTILVGVVILVTLGIVMMTNSGNRTKRRTLHYPEERYF